MKRNFLCIKEIDNLENSDLLLYHPYKNIIKNFFEIAINKEAISFDPVSRAFSGIDRADKDIREYYEALLGVTSYYQASKGGRGKYIEKKFASISEYCTLNIQIKYLPLWLKYPTIVRKKSIFDNSALNDEEKSKLRLFDWDWIGTLNETTDLGNILQNENRIVFVELKNRVDSGGTAARREIWDTKFKNILSYFIENKNLFTDSGGKKYTLLSTYNYFNIQEIDLFLGILFGVDGKPASIESDKTQGFYSTNIEGLKALKNYVEKSKKFKILNFDIEKFMLKLELKDYNFKITIGAIYGNDIPKFFLNKNINIENLLYVQFDDIWLSQLLAIEERKNLLKYNTNLLIIIKNVIERNYEIRVLFNKFILEEGRETTLKELLEKLLPYLDLELSNKRFIPNDRTKEEYTSDLLYFYGSVEA